MPQKKNVIHERKPCNLGAGPTQTAADEITRFESFFGLYAPLKIPSSSLCLSIRGTSHSSCLCFAKLKIAKMPQRRSKFATSLKKRQHNLGVKSIYFVNWQSSFFLPICCRGQNQRRVSCAVRHTPVSRRRSMVQFNETRWFKASYCVLSSWKSITRHQNLTPFRVTHNYKRVGVSCCFSCTFSTPPPFRVINWHDCSVVWFSCR